ncbi:MAG: hypothetical protein AAF927_01735 [Bacteroidota bacterium]
MKGKQEILSQINSLKERRDAAEALGRMTGLKEAANREFNIYQNMINALEWVIGKNDNLIKNHRPSNSA